MAVIGETLRNSNAIYYDAFVTEMTAIWGFTQFANEIENLTYYKALSSFLKNNEIGAYERRELLYAMMKPNFSYNESNDLINKMFGVMPTDNLYVSRVLRNICNIYTQAPQREIEGKNNDKLLTYLDECKFDYVMQKVHRAVKLCGEIAVRPRFRHNKLELVYLTPELYRYKTDTYGNMTEFWVHYQTYDKNNVVIDRFHYWDKDVYKVKDLSGQDVEFKYKIGDEEKVYKQLVNPLGKIPYELITIDNNQLDDIAVDSFDLWELCRGQLYCNKLDMMVDENLTYNGFSVWLAINCSVPGKDFVLGPSRIIDAKHTKDNQDSDIPPDLRSINPQQQYSEIEELKLKKIKQILKNMGLPSTVIEDKPGLGGAISGVAMKIDRKELDEYRQEDLIIMKIKELAIIKLIMEVVNKDIASPNPMLFDPFDKYTININYAELETFAEPKDEYEFYTNKFNDGLISPKDYVVFLTGNDTIETDEQAIEYIKKNKDYLKQIKGVQDDEHNPTDDDSGDAESGNATGTTDKVKGIDSIFTEGNKAVTTIN
jgi:hypothetical protein